MIQFYIKQDVFLPAFIIRKTSILNDEVNSPQVFLIKKSHRLGNSDNYDILANLHNIANSYGDLLIGKQKWK